MRVLTITPYVTIIGRKEFERNKTGFGYMVYDIAKAIANHTYDDGSTINVDVLATDSRGSSFDIERVHYLKRSLWLMARYLFRCIKPEMVRGLLNQYPLSRGSRIRLWYYWALTGYIDYLIANGGYDVVHIHSASPAGELWMAICKKYEIKYVVTLHGLASFSDTFKLEPARKQYERDFLKRVAFGEIPITVISTGIKKIIEKTYGVSECKKVNVVCNSFNFDTSEKKLGEGIMVKSKYGLPQNSRFLVCVGNVSVRKNQAQLITAFNHLPQELAEHTYILFLGVNQTEDYTIEKLKEGSKWCEHFIPCGFVPKDIVRYYYEQCDGVALMSLSEGFGLSLVEGMHFGKPCMSFTDVDAYEDIYHPEAMVGVEVHNDAAVAKGMEKLLTSEWNAQKIKEVSKKFEASAMAVKFKKVYELL